MRALRYLDKQFIVLPAYMLAINLAAYSIAIHGGYGQPGFRTERLPFQFECDFSNCVRNLLSHIS